MDYTFALSITPADRHFHAPALNGVRRIIISGASALTIGTKRRADIEARAWQRVLRGDYGIEFRAHGGRWTVEY